MLIAGIDRFAVAKPDGRLIKLLIGAPVQCHTPRPRQRWRAAPADEATIWFEKARNYTPAHPNIRAQLAAAHALKGDSERAAAELAEACRLSGDDRYTSITRVKATRY